VTGVCTAVVCTAGGGNNNCGCGSTCGIGSGVSWLVGGWSTEAGLELVRFCESERCLSPSPLELE